ncbi:MAG: hypothetical protein HS103_00530 [Anaerolineales bacterium]|nr:hypothetical protein [Anaerolineales bacterium]
MAARGFDVLVRADARQYMDNVMPCLSAYYETFGAWTGLNGILPERNKRRRRQRTPPPS